MAVDIAKLQELFDPRPGVGDWLALIACVCLFADIVWFFVRWL